MHRREPRGCSSRRRPGRARPAAFVAIAAALALAVACAPRARDGSGPGAPAPGIALELPEHYAHSIAALGHPGARRAFQAGDGSAVSTGESTLEWRLPDAGRVRVTPVWFERDGVPVAHWEMRAPDRTVSFEAAAAQLVALGDTSLVLSVRATARATGAGPVDVTLETRVRALPDGPCAVPWDAPPEWRFEEYWSGREAFRNGRVVAVMDPDATPAGDPPTHAHPARFEGPGPGRLAARCAARLDPGTTRSWTFLMPLYPAGAKAAARLRALDHAQVAGAARGYWRAVLHEAARLETPDTLVNAAWRAAIVTLVLCHEGDADAPVPIGNPFQYRDVWLRDGARAVRALAVAGLGGWARGDARTLARFQLPSGVLISQRGQLDGTGEAVWAFEQASAIPPDTALARALLPVASRGVAWIARQRDATEGLKLPWGGLLPYGDPRDNEMVRAQLVGNDAWSIAGCEALVVLARRAGDAATAARAAEEAAEYRRAFDAALARTRSADVPPSWQGPGRDWGNAAAGWPTFALAPSSPRLAALARRMHARAGASGLTCYGSDDSLHTYIGADLAQDALRAGRAAEARAWLRSLLAHSSSTLGQAEIFDRGDGDFGANLPPHATAAAGIVDLLRDMVVADNGDTLEIALGADPSWWEGTSLERAPTRFGVLDVRLDAPSPSTRHVQIDPATPAPVRVRVPDGWRASGVESKSAEAAGDRWIVAPAGTRDIAFVVEEAP